MGMFNRGTTPSGGRRRRSNAAGRSTFTFTFTTGR